MHFSLAVAPALFFGFAAAAAVNSAEKCSATDPTNPQNLINCPPNVPVVRVAVVDADAIALGSVSVSDSQCMVLVAHTLD
ncbi:hypothetical protein GGG16DRAFT_115612 [Schizophyllum commune]